MRCRWCGDGPDPRRASARSWSGRDTRLLTYRCPCSVYRLAVPLWGENYSESGTDKFAYCALTSARYRQAEASGRKLH